MENNERKLLRFKDALIIVSVIAAVFVFYALLPEKTGEKALISRDGSVIAEIPLSGTGEYVFPEIPDMVFAVDNGAVSVTESGCSDKICVRTGKISRGGEAIICVPNRVAVTIENGAESDVDVVMR